MDLAKKVKGLVEPSDFISEDNRVLFKIIMKKIEKDEPYDIPLLIENIRRDARKYEDIDVKLLIYARPDEFLINLMKFDMPISLLPHYVDRFKERKLKKQFVEISNHAEEKNINEILDEVENLRTKIPRSSDLKTLGEIIMKVIKRIEEGQGVDFNFSLTKLNNYLGGICGKELLVIGGWTSPEGRQAKLELF